MNSLFYFAYGSNMSTPRLTARVPSAHAVSVALPGHRFRFHKRSRDGSAKCDIAPGDALHDSVYGVVFELLAAQKPALDRAEGLGHGYAQKSVSVVDRNGGLRNAFVYYATRIDPGVRPYHWYKEHVVRGAREHRLPTGYIHALEAIASVPDPDPARHARELAIYR